MPASPSSLIASLSAAPAGLCPQELASGRPTALARVPIHVLADASLTNSRSWSPQRVCAVVAGYRSYTAIGEWVADLPTGTAVLLGIDADRRPSDAMIRRLLQALNPICSPRRSEHGLPQRFHTSARLQAGAGR